MQEQKYHHKNINKLTHMQNNNLRQKLEKYNDIASKAILQPISIQYK